MKIRTLTVSMAVAGLLAGAAGAAPVSSGDALCAVRGWVALKESLDGAAAGAPQTPVAYEGRAGKGLFYVVPLEGGGYVVTSGDDRSTPVLAYSAGGRFEASEENPLWCLLSGRAAAESVRAESGARALGAAAGESANAARWNRLRAAGAAGARPLGGSPQAAPADLRVPELLCSDWSQGRIGNWAGTSYPYCFNMYTPEIGGERAVCGCVATSGAQIMRYFQHPTASVAAQTRTCTVEGVDTSLTMMGGTYDWANMPTNINSMYSQSPSSTLAYREAIGKLTYDVGVAVGMDYTANGSGAMESNLATALVNVFGYRNAAYFFTNGGLPAETLKKAVLPSLDAKRPCGIGISNTSTKEGHAIVADGYGYSDGTLYIHFNMGWKDLAGSNAWYAPPEFDVRSDIQFDTIDEVICNIFTDTGSEFCSIASGRVLDGNGNPVAGATVTGTTTLLNGVVTNMVATSDEHGIYAIILPAVEKPCTVKATTADSLASNEITFNIALTDTFMGVGNTYGNDLVVDRVPAPTISPDGGSFSEASIEVTIACPLSGATIRYTLDGTEPTASSPSVANGGTITVTRSASLKAKAFMEGYTESATASATFAHIVDLETPDCLLEYVKSTGAQFVDTGIKAKSGTKAEIVFSSQISSGNNTHNILGASDGNVGMSFHKIGGGRWWFYRYNTNNNYIEVGASVRTENIGNDRQPANTKYTYTADFSKSGYITIVVSGGAYTAATIERNIGSTMSIDRNLYIFANNNAGTANEFHSATIYGLKIWQIDSNDEYQLVRDFRPCMRYGRAALWDVVSGKIFFSGSGTDLTAGPVATPQFERKAVAYVESTKVQYVNTGVCPKTGTKTEVKVQFKNDWSTTTSAVVLGTGKHGGSSRFWMPAAYNKYMYAGCGSVQCYIEYNHTGGPNPTCSKLDKQINHSEVYTFTTEMTTDGKYNVTAIGGKFDGGYVYRDVSVQGDFLSSDNPMYLFGANENGSLANGSSIRCYGAKIWQTNGVDGTYVLLRDMTPCQLEGRAGMYDAVNDEILYSGSGTDLAIGGAAVWNNTIGDGLFENPANWSTGAVPTDGDVATVNVSGETTLIVTERHALARLSVTGSGTLAFVGDGSLSYKRLDIASAATVVRTGLAGLVDGGLTGAGTFVLDPGAGNTLTMTKSNTGFTGEAVINSGTVKFGDATSFGPVNRSSSIRVRNGGTLDTGNIQEKNQNSGEKNKVILEEGATLAANPGLEHTISAHQFSLITTLTLEGNATIDTSHGDVSMGLKWHDAQLKLNLGGNTLTVKGNGAFSISYCLISGTGKIDILEGATVWSTQDYDNVDVSTTFSEGTVHIHEGACWALLKYHSSYPARLSVKHLNLDGSVTRAADNHTLTVTGSITGKGTTPTLTMGSGAVFKPNGTDYLTVTESLSGEMAVDASGLDFEGRTDPVPLFRMGSSEVLPAISSVSVSGAPPEWHLQQTADGCGYDLVRKPGLAIRLK